MKEIIDFKERFHSDENINLSNLHNIIENFGRHDKKYKARSKLFLSDKNPIDLFEEWIESEYEINVHSYEDFYCVNLKREIGKNRKAKVRVIEGTFYLYNFENSPIWIVLSSDNPDFFKLGVNKFMNSYKPEISPIYLSTNELKKIFINIQNEHNCEVYVKKAVLYSHVEEGEISFKKYKMIDLFEKAEIENRYIDKIEFILRNIDGIQFHGFISRSGMCNYYSGKIGFIKNVIIPKMSEKAILKSKILKNKEREHGTLNVNPICIEYEKDLFKTKEDNLKLIEILGKVKWGAVSVYHKNPYLHASFLDFVDGSNFDILVTNSCSIKIIPNFKCSVHSLMRVSDHISKDFFEGKLAPYHQDNIPISSFIGE